MGQTAYSPPAGGGPGSNLWVQNGDTSLSPIPGSVGVQIPDNINPQFTAVTNFIQANISAAGGFLRWSIGLFGFVNIAETDDGGGNTAQTKQSFTSFSSIATNSANTISRIIHSAAGVIADIADNAGNKGSINVGTAGILNTVKDTLNNNSGIIITPVSASIVANAAGGGGTKLLGVNTTNVGIVTDQVSLGLGVMPAATVGTLEVFDGAGVSLGKINLT